MGTSLKLALYSANPGKYVLTTEVRNLYIIFYFSYKEKSSSAIHNEQIPLSHFRGSYWDQADTREQFRGTGPSQWSVELRRLLVLAGVLLG